MYILPQTKKSANEEMDRIVEEALDHYMRNNSKELEESGDLRSACVRLTNDLKTLYIPNFTAVSLSLPNTLLNFTITVMPIGGYYKDGVFKFNIKIKKNYPYVPPKVKCLQTIFHPNITTSGTVCLNILRLDWQPVLDVSHVVWGLFGLFCNPNSIDAVNTEASELFDSNKTLFGETVASTMSGKCFNGIQYSDVINVPKP